VILANGEVVEDGAAREVLTNPKHPATRKLLMRDEG
jgi:ABC-type dipeptide/oligopeptide/nickel transport system ATPase component